MSVRLSPNPVSSPNLIIPGFFEWMRDMRACERDAVKRWSDSSIKLREEYRLILANLWVEAEVAIRNYDEKIYNPKLEAILEKYRNCITPQYEGDKPNEKQCIDTFNAEIKALEDQRMVDLSQIEAYRLWKIREDEFRQKEKDLWEQYLKDLEKCRGRKPVTVNPGLKPGELDDQLLRRFYPPIASDIDEEEPIGFVLAREPSVPPSEL